MSVQLIHGDCLDVVPTLFTSKAQLVFCDMPYGVTKNKWDVLLPLDRLWKQLFAATQDDAAYVFTCNFHLAAALAQSNAKNFRYELIWQKSSSTGFLNASKQPLRSHEYILVFARRRPVYNPQMVSAKALQGRSVRWRQTTSENWAVLNESRKPWQETGLRFPQSVVTIASEKRQLSVHPTQKPVALLEWLIRTYTNEGDTVLDPVAGSGTTAIAAMRTGRNVVCIEKDRQYYETMIKRVEAEKAQLKGAKA